MTAIRAQLPYISYRFSGDDALSFLQGQLTQDISKITPNSCQYSAYCDPKGRMLANFLIFHDGVGYVLRLHEALSESVIKRLKMFMLRAKVTVERLNRETVGLNQSGAQLFCDNMGVALPEAFGRVGNDVFTLCALPHGWYELSLSVEAKTQGALASIEEHADDIGILRLQGGHFNVLPETHESLLPQQTSLEELGAINYTKGCYVGQEIIARNKYRGKRTKAMGFALLNASAELTLPAAVSSNGRTVGQVIEYHRTPTQTACLAILSLDSFEQPATVAEHNTTFSVIN